MSDGARLATWTDPGTAGAPAVILVHGGPGLWDYLAPLAELLTGRATVHRYDQRRCGSSTGPGGITTDDTTTGTAATSPATGTGTGTATGPATGTATRTGPGTGAVTGPGTATSTGTDTGLAAVGSTASDLTMERFVEDIEELRLAFGHDRVVLIGHSFGATLALAYAGTHPERVTALGYVDGVGVGDWRTSYRAERTRRQAPWAGRLAELTDRDRTPEEEVEWRRITWATDYADPQAGYDLAEPMARSPHTIDQQVNRALMTFDDMDQITWATAVRCPITFVHGSSDPRPVGPVVALAAHARAPRKRVVTEAGHLPWLEQPERMREILAELVASASHRD